MIQIYTAEAGAREVLVLEVRTVESDPPQAEPHEGHGIDRSQHLRTIFVVNLYHSLALRPLDRPFAQARHPSQGYRSYWTQWKLRRS